MEQYSIERNEEFTYSRFEGHVDAITLRQALRRLIGIARAAEEHTFVFDYSHASLDKLSEEEATGMAKECILTFGRSEGKLLVGIVPNRRDYALACMWASKLCVSQKFNSHQVYLFISAIEAWKFVKQRHVALSEN